jgi:hypothetical protein
MYHYFISFSHVTNGNIGFGNMELVLDGKITGMDMLNKIARNIERDCFIKNVVILNFQLLEDNK